MSIGLDQLHPEETLRIEDVERDSSAETCRTEIERNRECTVPTGRSRRSRSDHEDEEVTSIGGTHPQAPPPMDGMPGGVTTLPSEGREEVQELGGSSLAWPKAPAPPDFFDWNGVVPKLKSFKQIFREAETWADDYLDSGLPIPDWHHDTFYMARVLAGYPGFLHLDPEERLDWIYEARPGISEECADAINDQIDHVEAPIGPDRLDLAFADARKFPLMPKVCERRNQPGFAKFTSVAFHLQRRARSLPVFFPRTLIARMLNIDPGSIRSWERRLVRLGFMEKVEGKSRIGLPLFKFRIDRIPKLCSQYPNMEEFCP